MSEAPQPTKWEYFVAPVLSHVAQQILNNFGADGWELVQLAPGPNPDLASRLLQASAAAGVLMLASERLAELGIELPIRTTPLGAYIPAKQWGSRSSPAASCRSWLDGKIPTGRLGGGLGVLRGSGGRPGRRPERAAGRGQRAARPRG